MKCPDTYHAVNMALLDVYYTFSPYNPLLTVNSLCSVLKCERCACVPLPPGSVQDS